MRETGLEVACSLGVLTRPQAERARATPASTATTTTSRRAGAVFPSIVTTHT